MTFQPGPDGRERPDLMMPDSADDKPTKGQRANRGAAWALLAAAVVVAGGVIVLSNHGGAQRQGETSGAAQANGNAPAAPGAPWNAQPSPARRARAT